jgi:hypothetical protein
MNQGQTPDATQIANSDAHPNPLKN